ncbi:MAG: NADH-quinone oxidoreductase subunit NuoH [Planctomycetota bacterium]|nr:MAG: NADH-quinone oxidoreductase subunit NuoH [Planctomycetota bacterium]
MSALLPFAAAGNGLTDWLAGLFPAGVPFWILGLLGAVIAFALIMVFVSVLAMFSTWLERKVAGHIQVRYGPMRVGGWHGWAQAIADGVKLLIKEDIVLADADRALFKIAPCLVLGAALAAFVALPFGPNAIVADLDLGVFFILAVSSVTTLGVIMAGWGSNNKWSLYGAMREAAQVASYEIPLGLSLMMPVMYYGSLSLHRAGEMQADWFGLHWYVFSDSFWLAIPSFILFFTAALAETKRSPFDLPESESELVAGFHTEYSGIRFSFFFMEEYAAMYLMSAVGTAFWFGAWNFPGLELLAGSALYAPLAVTVFVVKSMILVFVMMWVRWTVPRIRIDQVMTMGYKYLTPLCLILVFLASVWEWAKAALTGA